MYANQIPGREDAKGKDGKTLYARLKEQSGNFDKSSDSSIAQSKGDPSTDKNSTINTNTNKKNLSPSKVKNPSPQKPKKPWENINPVVKDPPKRKTQGAPKQSPAQQPTAQQTFTQPIPFAQPIPFEFGIEKPLTFPNLIDTGCKRRGYPFLTCFRRIKTPPYERSLGDYPILKVP